MPKATSVARKENAAPNRVPDSMLITQRSERKVTLTRADGADGRPHLESKVMCIGYKGCKCGLIVFIPEALLHCSSTRSERLRDHERSEKHKNAEEAKAGAFAASFRRLDQDDAGVLVESRRALAVPRAFSQLGDGPPSTLRPVDRRATAAAATPAAPVLSTPATQNGIFTVQLPRCNVADAGKSASAHMLPGYMIFTGLDSGSSAEIWLAKKRTKNDRLAQLDAQILGARASKGVLLVKRREEVEMTAKLLHNDASAKFFAVKVFYDTLDATFDFGDEGKVFLALAERGVSCNFLVQCVDMPMTAAGQGALVLEYGAGGSLASLLEMMEERGVKLSEPSAPILASHMFSGLAALHEADVSHRDVKLDNVIVCLGTDETLELLERFAADPFVHGATERALVKICDFALACLGPSHTFAGNGGDEALGPPQGTLEYLAPEIFAAERYDAKIADVFAAGICFQQLLRGVTDASPAAERLLAKLLEPDVTLRISAAEAVKMAKHLVICEAGVPAATAATPLRLAGMSGFTPAAQPAQPARGSSSRGSSSRASRSRAAASRTPGDLMCFTPIAEAPGDAEA